MEIFNFHPQTTFTPSSATVADAILKKSHTEIEQFAPCKINRTIISFTASCSPSSSVVSIRELSRPSQGRIKHGDDHSRFDFSCSILLLLGLFLRCPKCEIRLRSSSPHRLPSEAEAERFEIGSRAVLETPTDLKG